MLRFALRALGLSIAAMAMTSSVSGCSGGRQPEAANYSGSGPYAVGVTFLTLADGRPVDVWYPSEEAAITDGDPFSYNLNDAWPESIRSKAPSAEDIVVEAYAEISASGDGPFPVILESHGFGSSRRDGSLNHRHLASWGFVVVAPEHYERNRATVIGQPVEFEPQESVDVLRGALDLVRAESLREGSVLQGTVDPERIAVDGVSAGGRAALDLAGEPWVGAVVARAPAGSDVPDSTVPILLIAADRDVAIDLDDVRALYDQFSPPKAIAVILNGGHNTFTDACAQIRQRGGLDVEALSRATGFPAELLEFGNNGCTEDYVDPAAVWPVINHLQVAHIRAALGIDTSDAALAENYIEETFPGLLLEYRQER